MAESAGAGIIHVHVEGAREARSANRDRLTPSQLDVMRMRARGMTNAEVARALDRSEQTIKNHSADAFKRLGTTDIVSAMNLLGWVRIR